MGFKRKEAVRASVGISPSMCLSLQIAMHGAVLLNTLGFSWATLILL